MDVEAILRISQLAATPAMTDGNQLSFNLPLVSRKKVTASFDGGRLSSDAGVMLLALADRRRGIANTLAALIADPRDPSHITHTVADVLRACWRLAAAIRYVVTSLKRGDAEHVYATHYCARGQAENLIKQHKAQLASDRTSCRSPLANQMRLILHTGAYWLLLDLRNAIPSWNPLRHTEFATIRLRLLKVAGRIIETASRIRIALASCCPEAETFSLVALKLQPSAP